MYMLSKNERERECVCECWGQSPSRHSLVCYWPRNIGRCLVIGQDIRRHRFIGQDISCGLRIGQDSIVLLCSMVLLNVSAEKGLHVKKY